MARNHCFSNGCVLFLAQACSNGGHSGAAPGLTDSGKVPDEAGACGSVSNARIPANHRAEEGSACPNDRAPAGIPASCAPDSGVTPRGDCQQDSDCNAGTNGRCVQLRGCYMACSYDECFHDSDCAGNVPCQCRGSASSTAANICLVNSNCRVDNDCGPGGYCSPSQLDGCIRMCNVPCGSESHCYEGTTEVPCWCGQSCGGGYFCHRQATHA